MKSKRHAVRLLAPLVFATFVSELAIRLFLHRRRPEEDFEAIFESSPFVIMAVVDETGTIVRVNRQAEKVFGYSAEELAGQQIEILIPERLRTAHQADRMNYMKTPTARPMGAGRDLVGRRKDGTEVPVEVALTPMNVGGKTMILTTLVDVSVRKSIEFQRDQAVESAQIGMWDWNIATGKLIWSERCKALFGLRSDANLTYETFLELLDPRDRDRVDGTIKAALTQRQPYETEMRIPLPDGNMRWLLAKGNGYFDSQGNARRMSGIAMDITDRKLSEEAERESMIRLDLASDVAKLGNWDWNVVSGALYTSPRFNRIHGLPEDQGPKTIEDIWSHWHPEDKPTLERALQASIQSGADFNTEHRIIWPDGSIHWVLARGRALRSRAGEVTGLTGTCSDITDRKQLETEREQAVRSRDDVIAIVSHDLRTPLSAIDLNARLLLKTAPACNSPDAIEKGVEGIRHSTTQMAKLINDLLDISKIEAGALNIEPEEQTLGSIVNDTLGVISPIAAEKSLHIEQHLTCSTAKLICDHDRVVQALSNILGNAVQHTPPGGNITIGCELRDDFLEISVSDNGPGIAQEALPHVFDRFWQAKQNKKAGAGLGLAIVKGIVEAHGGDVRVESKPHSGTTFYLTLPTEQKMTA